MKFKSVFKWMVWSYQKYWLGFVGEGADISLLADLRGARKNIFVNENVTICKYALLEVDPSEDGRSKIVIGNDTLLSSFVILRTYDGTISIGNSCFINSFSALYGHGDLKIGNGVLIGPQVTIIPANYGFKNLDIPFREQTPSKQGIIIEDNVWIGAGVTILDGCTIGRGAVIGAGAVVTKSVEPYTIMGGVPAKKIRSRE